MFLILSKVLGVGLILFFSFNSITSAANGDKDPGGATGNSSQKSRGKSPGPKKIIATGDNFSKVAKTLGRSSNKNLEEKAEPPKGASGNKVSSSLFGQSHEEILQRGTLPGAMGKLLLQATPFPGLSPEDPELFSFHGMQVSREPNVSNRRGMQASLMPDGTVKSAQTPPMSLERALGYLEIEVSHSEHTFKLFAGSSEGRRQALYECRVGLGGPGFPTPVGVYFVTHIYDDDPWWIPPKDRAWAAGDKPSRRVYGGTMAPLLKKRDVRQKKDVPDAEDKIAGQVKLEDYGYRFHGTNSPRSIGRNQSHGCVRMIPDDARKVAALIKEFGGTADRRESENGSYVLLRSPVRLNLVK